MKLEKIELGKKIYNWNWEKIKKIS